VFSSVYDWSTGMFDVGALRVLGGCAMVKIHFRSNPRWRTVYSKWQRL